MLMTETPVIRQRLFSAKTPEGANLYLAFLLTGGCAILRDDELVERWDGEEGESLDCALDRFLAMTKLARGVDAPQS
jgi:hypothetical protein